MSYFIFSTLKADYGFTILGYRVNRYLWSKRFVFFYDYLISMVVKTRLKLICVSRMLSIFGCKLNVFRCEKIK